MGLSDERLVWLLPAVISVIGCIIWFVRLEGRINYSERAVEKLEAKHDALDMKIVDKLSIIEKSLSKIEGIMGMLMKDEK